MRVSLFTGGYQARQDRRRYLERGLSIIATFGILYWLGINFHKSPSQFFQASLIGLSNGVLYALIALGYTLVYGIIELINFAHGDLFLQTLLPFGSIKRSPAQRHGESFSCVWLPS